MSTFSSSRRRVSDARGGDGGICAISIIHRRARSGEIWRKREAGMAARLFCNGRWRWLAGARSASYIAAPKRFSGPASAESGSSHLGERYVTLMSLAAAKRRLAVI